MMRRTAEWNRLLKGLAIAFSLISYSVAPAVGEEAPDAFDSQAAKGPDPRRELRAEAELPGVDPNVVRNVVRPNMTLLADPTSPPVANTVAIPAGDEQVLIGSLKTELDATKTELAKTKEMVGEVIKEYKQIAEARELPPLKDAEVRVFQLKNTKAAVAAQKVELLFGSQPVRIAVDEASNGLIVFGKAEAIPQVEQLIVKLDELAVAAPGGFSPTFVESDVAAASPAAPRRALMLRVFWLANNGVEALDSVDMYLPTPVINSLAKLGLSEPRLVTQTVNSLSVEEGGKVVEFSTNIPALLFGQPVMLVSSGTMNATTDGRTEVDMQLSVGGAGVNCELKGSLAMPVGHFMVLGTANSIVPTPGPNQFPPGAEGGGMGFGGADPAMGGMMGDASAQPAAYNASRFAFVIQVIEAESFDPEGNGQ